MLHIFRQALSEKDGFCNNYYTLFSEINGFFVCYPLYRGKVLLQIFKPTLINEI